MSWTQSEVNLIESIKLFPVLFIYEKHEGYRNLYQVKAKAWEILANLVNLELKDLRNQWRNMLYTYIKINLLIRINDREKIDFLRKDDKNKKYFDGSLSFLDPHISHIKKDEDICSYMRAKFYDINKIDAPPAENTIDSMNVKRVTQDMVRNLLKTRSDEVTLNETEIQYILQLVKKLVDQSLNKLVPSQTQQTRSNTNTDEMEIEENKTSKSQNKNLSIDVNEKNMKKFCNDLGKYITGRFSLEVQSNLRRQIACLVTAAEMKK